LKTGKAQRMEGHAWISRLVDQRALDAKKEAMRRHGGGPRGIRCSSRGAVLRLHRGPTTTPASMQAATPADACTPSDS
jgi:hypothetical protein